MRRPVIVPVLDSNPVKRVARVRARAAFVLQRRVLDVMRLIEPGAYRVEHSLWISRRLDCEMRGEADLTGRDGPDVEVMGPRASGYGS